MTKEEVLGILQENGFALEGEKEISHGIQFSFRNGSKVNVFTNGKVQPQGKLVDQVKQILAMDAPSITPTRTMAERKKVFVVYGHDTGARAQLEAMLRRWELEPLILEQLPSEGQTIIEKLEKYTSDAKFAVVLATPDDIGYRIECESEKAYRVRQNVVLELGMMLSRLGRKNVAILLRQQENMERPSDIEGLIYLPFKDNVSETKVDLAKEMVAQGYRIDVSKL